MSAASERCLEAAEIVDRDNWYSCLALNRTLPGRARPHYRNAPVVQAYTDLFHDPEDPVEFVTRVTFGQASEEVKERRVMMLLLAAEILK